MPRLLPRLVKWLEKHPVSQHQQKYTGPLITRRRPKRTLWQPLKSPPSLTLDERTQSLLLDEDNVVYNRRLYIRHKRVPPVVRLRKAPRRDENDLDVPREMTEQQRQWWSSPYLRMLASPVRTDLLSKKLLPKDFLIRLVYARVQLSETQRESTLLPDCIQHPRFKTPLPGRSLYVPCWKGMHELLSRRILVRLGKTSRLHPHMFKQVGHLLRLRVLQELEMLRLRLQASPTRALTDADEYVKSVENKDPYAPLLRRLTRGEWNTLRQTGTVPWPDVVAVLVVPPVNRDPVTKQRVVPHFSDLPPPERPVLGDKEVKEHSKSQSNTLPQSVLYPSGEDTRLPRTRVPLYNGAAFFPDPGQRAALHQRLCELLEVERKQRRRAKRLQSTTAAPNADTKSSSVSDAPSHAFALFSSAATVLRADTVPLAIALWRVRMWEGGGFEESSLHIKSEQSTQSSS